MNTPRTRRTFLKTTTAASALAFPAILRSQPPGTPSPNNPLNVAIIGAGGSGGAAVEGVRHENIVAICDVDEERGRGAVKTLKTRFPDEGESAVSAEHFNDYRKMFDKLGSKIDAVTVSIPDHMHFPAAMTAMGLGKHAYVEKPRAHTVWETRRPDAVVAPVDDVVTAPGELESHFAPPWRRENGARAVTSSDRLAT